VGILKLLQERTRRTHTPSRNVFFPFNQKARQVYRFQLSFIGLRSHENGIGSAIDR